jgi:phospholipid/cholesterol/gamma-HCH transport system substrate-binding protein
MKAKLKPESRHALRSFKVGIGGLLFIAFLCYMTLSAQNGNPLTSKTYVKAAFADIDTLSRKDPVRQFSKGIGRVIDIGYENGQAIVTLQIEKGGDYPVYKNATAAVKDQSAIGSKFVELNPGTPDAGALGDGVIPQSQTKSSRDIYQILDLFDPSARAATSGFLTQFGGGLTGQADNFRDFVATAPDTLTDLGTVSHSIATPKADLPSLLNAADRLSGRFKGREQQIASLINQTDSTFAAFTVDDAKPLSDLLQKAPSTLDELKAATDSLNAPLSDTHEAMAGFEPGAKSLGDSEKDLRGTFRDGVPVLHDVPDVADQTAPAFGDLTPAFSDTSKLSPRAADALNDLAHPLRDLAPYSKELGYLFVRGHSFLSEGTADGVHYARFNADFQGPYSFTAGVLKSCAFDTDPYPKPGQADNDHTTLGPSLGGNVPCGIQTQTPLGGLPR